MNKIKTLLSIVFTITFLLLPGKVLAGDIPAGEKLIDYCFKISNVDKFKDYVILFDDGTDISKKQVKQNECINFVFNGKPKLMALPKNEFNRTKFLDNFKNSKLIPASIELKHPLSVPIADRTNQIIDRLEITEISAASFNVNKVQAEFLFDNNKQEIIRYDNQDVRPTSSRGYTWAEQNVWLLVAVVVILIALLVFVMRARLIKAAQAVTKFTGRKQKPKIEAKTRLGSPLK